MSWSYVNEGLWVGVSIEPKPSNPRMNELALETDTKKLYRFDGAAWVAAVENVGGIPDEIVLIAADNTDLAAGDVIYSEPVDLENQNLLLMTVAQDANPLNIALEGSSDGVDWFFVGGTQLQTSPFGNTNYSFISSIYYVGTVPVKKLRAVVAIATDSVATKKPKVSIVNY